MNDLQELHVSTAVLDIRHRYVFFKALVDGWEIRPVPEDWQPDPKTDVWSRPRLAAPRRRHYISVERTGTRWFR